MFCELALPFTGKSWLLSDRARKPACRTGNHEPVTRRTTTSRPPVSPDAVPGQASPPHGEHDQHLNDWITRLLDTAPPLTATQRDILALLLRAPGRPGS